MSNPREQDDWVHLEVLEILIPVQRKGLSTKKIRDHPHFCSHPCGVSNPDSDACRSVSREDDETGGPTGTTETADFQSCAICLDDLENIENSSCGKRMLIDCFS